MKKDLGMTLEDRLEKLARAGMEADPKQHPYIWRPSYSEAYMAAADQIKKWLEADGFQVYTDAAGNIFGRMRGAEKEKEKGTVVLGSHLDTVKNGGKYDGAAGIICAMAAVREAVIEKGTPRKTLEVVAMAEEEGSRFGSSYIGSRAMTGKLGACDLEEIDIDGKTLGAVLREAGLTGYTEENLRKAARKDIDAFVELHIEQGPSLEKEGLEIGVVTGIVGIYSYDVLIKGQQNHAGTTPMKMRLDPVVAAADFITAMTAYCKQVSPTATFTVGGIHAVPGLSNVIADRVNLALDFRDGTAEAMDSIEAELKRKAEVLRAEGYEVETIKRCDEKPVSLDEQIIGVVEDAAKEEGLRYKKMHSGAGHDAQVLSERFPTGMLFIPSVKGISHSPEEFTRAEDLANGARTLKQVVFRLAY